MHWIGSSNLAPNRWASLSKSSPKSSHADRKPSSSSNSDGESESKSKSGESSKDKRLESSPSSGTESLSGPSTSGDRLRHRTHSICGAQVVTCVDRCSSTSCKMPVWLTSSSTCISSSVEPVRCSSDCEE